MMDLRALRYFVSAVNEGSISRASIKCHVAQPSITSAIAKLENQFDASLLHRHSKGVSTTDKGQQLYTLAMELLQHADAVETRLNARPKVIKLRLAIDRSLQLSYVEHVISTIQALELSIEMEITDNPASADLRLTTRTGKPDMGLFLPIATERYCLLIPAKNELAHRQQLSFEDLNKQKLIERTQCENQILFDSMLEHLGLSLPIVARVDNEEWAFSLVAAGLGICFSPLPALFRDARFRIWDLNQLSAMSSPERQVGIHFVPNTSSEIQFVLDELSRFFTAAELSKHN